MRVSALFLHPFSESPGSTYRLLNLSRAAGTVGIRTTIMNPYETSREYCNNVHVRNIGVGENWESLRKTAYSLTKRLYYSRLFAKNPGVFIQAQKVLSKRLAKTIEQHSQPLDADVILAEQDFSIATCLELKKKTRIPLVADIHNLTPLELVSSDIISSKSIAFARLTEWMKEMMTQIDLIIAVSDEMQSYLVSEYDLDEDRIIVVPPGGDVGQARASPLSFEPPRVAYAGLVVNREHVDLFVRSVPYVSSVHPQTQFFMSKKGNHYPELHALAERIGANITPIWHDERDKFHSYLRSCCVGVLPSRKDTARRMGTPLKLLEYMAHGLPVVANDVGAWCNIIRDEELGIVTSDNPKSFAAGILQLVQNPDLADRLGKNGMRLVKKRYNWDNNAQILKEGYLSVVR